MENVKVFVKELMEDQVNVLHELELFDNVINYLNATKIQYRYSNYDDYVFFTLEV